MDLIDNPEELFNTWRKLSEASPYDSFKDNEFARKCITGFEIRAGEIIYAIRIKYGNTWGEWHGGTGGELYQVDLGGSKVAKINIVKGSYYGSSAIVQITIFTQNNKTHGPYGKVDKQSSETETTWEIPFGKGYFTGSSKNFIEDLEMQVEEDDDGEDDEEEDDYDEESPEDMYEGDGDVDEGQATNIKSLKCKVCNENARTHVFLYCGHFAACKTCADEIFLQPGVPTCPVCKKQVLNTIEIII